MCRAIFWNKTWYISDIMFQNQCKQVTFLIILEHLRAFWPCYVPINYAVGNLYPQISNKYLSARFLCYQVLDKDLQSNRDQDQTADDRSIGGKSLADLLPDLYPYDTDRKCDNGNDYGCSKCHQRSI